MLKINYSIILGCLIIALGIVLHGYIINLNIHQNNNDQMENYPNTDGQAKNVMDIKEVAEYLSMTEDKVIAIIDIEAAKLNNSGSFFGEMLPYFIVDENYYFSKKKIDSWLEDVVLDRREYDTEKFQMIR